MTNGFVAHAFRASEPQLYRAIEVRDVPTLSADTLLRNHLVRSEPRVAVRDLNREVRSIAVERMALVGSMAIGMRLLTAPGRHEALALAVAIAGLVAMWTVYREETKRLAIVVCMAVLGACGGASPLAPTVKADTFTVRALQQQTDQPLSEADVFVDGKYVGPTNGKGERAIPSSPGQTIGVLVVAKDGRNALAGTVYGKPGAGEVWTFWFGQE